MLDFGMIMDSASLLCTWQMGVAILFGTVFGVVTGAIPGFSTAMAMIVLLPYSYTLQPMTAVVMLSAVFMGSSFGGSISAILLNIPGTPQSIATCWDGFPMTQQGKANEAMGAALGSSGFGSCIGTVILLFVMKALGDFAVKFGAAEMFMVIIMGLTILSSLSTGNMLRGMIAACFGILLGTIGFTVTGMPRGTMGLVELMDGIPLMTTLIGMVAIPEILSLLNENMAKGSVADFKPDLKLIFRSMNIGGRSVLNAIRSSLIGVLIGILPGAGGTFATIVSYNEAKKASTDPSSFGKGSLQGIVAAESSNNASQGGSYAILLALGIPGGAATAVLYGALLVHNFVPGPRFVAANMEFCYAIALSLFLCTLAMVVLGGLLCYNLSAVLKVPLMILLPMLMVFCIVGTYSSSKVLGDLWIMLVLGTVGYLLKRYDFPVMAVVLGIILGKMAETYYVRSLQTYDSIGEVFSSPIFVVLFIITLLGAFVPVIMERYRKRMAKPSA